MSSPAREPQRERGTRKSRPRTEISGTHGRRLLRCSAPAGDLGVLQVERGGTWPKEVRLKDTASPHRGLRQRGPSPRGHRTPGLGGHRARSVITPEEVPEDLEGVTGTRGEKRSKAESAREKSVF